MFKMEMSPSKKISCLQTFLLLALLAFLLVFGEIQNQPYNRKIIVRVVSIPKYVRIARATSPSAISYFKPAIFKEQERKRQEVHFDKRMDYLYNIGASSDTSNLNPTTSTRISRVKMLNTLEKSFREALKESLQRKVSRSKSKDSSNSPQLPAATIVLEESDSETADAGTTDSWSTNSAQELILTLPDTEEYTTVDLDQFSGPEDQVDRQGDWDQGPPEGYTRKKKPTEAHHHHQVNHYAVPLKNGEPQSGTPVDHWHHPEGPRPLDLDHPPRPPPQYDQDPYQRPLTEGLYSKAPNLGTNAGTNFEVQHHPHFEPSLLEEPNNKAADLANFKPFGGWYQATGPPEAPNQGSELEVLLTKDDFSLDRLLAKLKSYWHLTKSKIHDHFLEKNKDKDAYDKSQKVLGKSISILALVSFMIYIVAILFQWIIATMSFPLLTSILGLVGGGGLNQILDLVGRRRRQPPVTTVVLSTTPTSLVEDEDFIELERKVRTAVKLFDL